MARIDKLIIHGKKQLQKNEYVITTVMGAYEGTLMGQKTLRTGIFMVTDTRLVFYGKKLFGFQIESFPFSNISSFERKKGMTGNSISFFASGNKVSMKWINRGDFQTFVAEIELRMGKKSEPASGGMDATEQIKSLASLRDSGILSEEEFTAKKKQLLGI